MASLYEFTHHDTSSSSSASSTYSIYEYDEEKYSSVPKSLYEYNTSIPISVPFDVEICDFDSPSNSAPLYACQREPTQEKGESTSARSLVFDSDFGSDSEVDCNDGDLAAPPAYYANANASKVEAEEETLKPKHTNKCSFLKLASIFSRCLGRRSRSSPSHSHPSPPPPYVSQEEVELIEERMRQLDIFFGGAPL